MQSTTAFEVAATVSPKGIQQEGAGSGYGGNRLVPEAGRRPGADRRARGARARAVRIMPIAAVDLRPRGAGDRPREQCGLPQVRLQARGVRWPDAARLPARRRAGRGHRSAGPGSAGRLRHRLLAPPPQGRLGDPRGGDGQRDDLHGPALPLRLPERRHRTDAGRGQAARAQGRAAPRAGHGAADAQHHRPGRRVREPVGIAAAADRHDRGADAQDRARLAAAGASRGSRALPPRADRRRAAWHALRDRVPPGARRRPGHPRARGHRADPGTGPALARALVLHAA